MFNRNILVLLFALVLCISSSLVYAGDNDRREYRGLTRERVIDNHQKRKKQLEKLLNEAKEKVSDHESGRTLLEDEEYKKFAKRVELYGRKYHSMDDIPDEREIQRMLDREKMRAERYLHREL